ncbi:hypothetical protein [Acidovorax kalamii]|uniref:hypothetical protein n=1 Tax=Acidovorax kalamii TaxID=2004485 RepID=UPI001056CD30|nr:hypothetical protein [Acidovorax kalamii]
MLPKIDTLLVCVDVREDSEDKREFLSISTPDIRSNKPYGIHDQQDGKTAFFQVLIEGVIAGRAISVAAPNEISLSLSSSRKSVNSARLLRRKISERAVEKNTLYKEEVGDVYDMLEEMQKAIVFAYRAVESFCNASIPDNYIYRKTGSKGIVEEYKKEQIERWISTSEKVSAILPEILHCVSPIKEEFWSDFKKLESLRNEIIHSKSSSSSNTLSAIFSDECETYVGSCLKLLHYFIRLDSSNQIFPMGFGESSIRAVSVPNADDYLQIISQEIAAGT